MHRFIRFGPLGGIYVYILNGSRKPTAAEVSKKYKKTLICCLLGSWPSRLIGISGSLCNSRLDQAVESLRIPGTLDL